MKSLWFWDCDWTEKAIWRRHHGLWEIVIIICLHIFFYTIHKTIHWPTIKNNLHSITFYFVITSSPAHILTSEHSYTTRAFILKVHTRSRSMDRYSKFHAFLSTVGLLSLPEVEVLLTVSSSCGQTRSSALRGASRLKPSAGRSLRCARCRGRWGRITAGHPPLSSTPRGRALFSVRTPCLCP